MRFIHIADVHLGAVPDGDKPWSEKRKQDLWDSFSEVIDQAEETHTDFLFIAGDLFHRQPLLKDLKEFRFLCEKLTHTKVVLIAGNHDYVRPKSYYRTFDFGDNIVFLGREEVEKVMFPEQNVCIYGFSYWHNEIPEGRLDGLHPDDPKRINILLAHGGDQAHVPFGSIELKNSGFDYMALGHIHKAEQIVPYRAVMAGALEPVNHTEYGSHGYWMGEVDKSHCQVRFVPIKKCEYVPCGIFVTKDTTNLELQQKVMAELDYKEAYQLLRIELEGQFDPAAEFDLKRIVQMDGVVDVSTEKLIPLYNYKKLKDDYKNGIISEYIKDMEARGKSRITEKALQYGVDALYRTMEKA